MLRKINLRAINLSKVVARVKRVLKVEKVLKLSRVDLLKGNLMRHLDLLQKGSKMRILDLLRRESRMIHLGKGQKNHLQIRKLKLKIQLSGKLQITLGTIPKLILMKVSDLEKQIKKQRSRS
jgi:hypothetical protein